MRSNTLEFHPPQLQPRPRTLHMPTNLQHTLRSNTTPHSRTFLPLTLRKAMLIMRSPTYTTHQLLLPQEPSSFFVAKLSEPSESQEPRIRYAVSIFPPDIFYIFIFSY